MLITINEPQLVHFPLCWLLDFQPLFKAVHLELPDVFLMLLFPFKALIATKKANIAEIQYSYTLSFLFISFLYTLSHMSGHLIDIHYYFRPPPTKYDNSTLLPLDIHPRLTINLSKIPQTIPFCVMRSVDLAIPTFPRWSGLFELILFQFMRALFFCLTHRITY